MKKITENKVQRMRNLVTGDYGAKTQKRSGYKKYSKKYNEGDEWEEDGKTWTIRNGVKQNKSKLKVARDYGKIPLSCPKCSEAMNRAQHKFMFKHYGHCLYCQTKAESKMHEEGTYNNWVIENVEKNFSKWKGEKKIQFETWLTEINSKKNITEAGLIEDWSEVPESVKNDIMKRFEEYMYEEEEKMNNLIEEQKI